MPAKPSRPRGMRAESPRDTLPESLASERAALFATLSPVVDMVGSFVGENVEVVLHDLTRPERSIVRILNGHVSGRSVGESILSGPDGDKGFVELLRALQEGRQERHSVIADYQTFTRSGKALRSSTVIFRDSGGTHFASICINADMSVVIQAHALLQGMLQRPGSAEPASEVRGGIDELMKEIIAESVQRFGKPVSVMDKDEKIHAVEAMMQRGLFIVKGGVERAATALGVTRFTVYNYLDVLRQRSVDTSLLPSRLRRKSSGR